MNERVLTSLSMYCCIKCWDSNPQRDEMKNGGAIQVSGMRFCGQWY